MKHDLRAQVAKSVAEVGRSEVDLMERRTFVDVLPFAGPKVVDYVDGPAVAD